MRIKLLTIGCTMLCVLLLPLNALAQQQQPGQQVFCDGSRDWGTFISSVISYNGFVEYWDDILVRYNTNICHYTDIDGLLRRLTTVRKQIRNAFYACADTTHMKQTYYELEAELFFLRNYIDTENGSFLVTSDQKLINDLRATFVINRQLFTDEEILKLFDRFKKRYKAKLDTYRNCVDPTWGALVDKWNQFKEDAGGIAPAVSQAKESFEKRWDRVENTPWRRGDDFFGDFVDVRVNSLPAEEGFQQIGEELERNLPEGYTFEQLQAAKSVSDENLRNLATEQQYLAQYQVQYGESSDAFTEEVTNRLLLLKSIIVRTFPFQNQTIQCTKGIINKQC